MAAITLSDAQYTLDQYLAAERCILTGGQGYTIGDREFKRADLKTVQDGVRYWQAQVTALTASAAGVPSGPLGRIRYGVPR